MYPQYMCILLYVIVFWCYFIGIVNWRGGYIRDLLSIGVVGGGRCICSICAFCYM